MGSQVYLNVTKFSREALGIHLIIPLLIFGAGVVVAWLKVKWTNSKAFIPTIFFMVIATVLEAIPSLNSKAGGIPLAIILHNVLILLACNAWQILQLHRWVQPQKKAGH
jgi:KinB signaling pathway activation protein